MNFLHNFGVATFGFFIFNSLAFSAVPLDELSTETLDAASGDWVWVLDGAAGYSVSRLFDTETGNMLGMLSLGYWSTGLAIPSHGEELYAVQTHFSRATRGERTDIVAIYDPVTLAPLAEVIIPPRRMSALTTNALYGISNDDKFLFVQNFTPAQTVSVVDLPNRSFIAEIDTPGCTGIYPKGSNSFITICGDGSLLQIEIDGQGNVVARKIAEPFFDPATDPVSVEGVIIKESQSILFASNNGYVYPVYTGEDSLTFGSKWSFLSEDERESGWRYGGYNRLALNHSTGELYILMQQGGDESYESPGSEVWVFDVESQKRVARFELEHRAMGIEITQGEVTKLLTSSITYSVPDATVEKLIEEDLGGILGNLFEVSVDVLDASNGELIRVIRGVTRTPNLLQVW